MAMALKLLWLWLLFLLGCGGGDVVASKGAPTGHGDELDVHGWMMRKTETLEEQLYRELFQRHMPAVKETEMKMANPVNIVPLDKEWVMIVSFMSSQVIAANLQGRFDPYALISGGTFCSSTCFTLDGPWGIEMDRFHGILYVSSFGSDHVLAFRLELTNLEHKPYTTVFLGGFGDSGTLDCPEGVALGNDGMLYVASFLDDRIVRFDVSSVAEDTNTDRVAYIDDFTNRTEANLDGPEDIAFDGNGNLLVASHFNNVVVRIAPDRTLTSVIAEGLQGPVGIVHAPKSRSILVSSYRDNTVIRYSEDDGGYMGVFAQGNGIRGPSGLYFDEHRDILFVASYENNRVIVFNTTHGLSYKLATLF